MMMKRVLLCSAAVSLAWPALAEDSRELSAHEHGSGALNIAIEGDQLAMELEVPGFDIVGFEYEATTDADKAAIEAAMETLGDPLALFVLPEAAGCAVTEASVELHGDEEHDEHDHEEHAEGEDHDHEEHAEGEDHDHEEHAEGEDHDHEEHAEGEAHDDHDHEEHAEEASHSEFHAEYLMTCNDMAALNRIELSYFATFENAEELEVQLVTEKGAALMEATPEEPVLDLSDAM